MKRSIYFKFLMYLLLSSITRPILGDFNCMNSISDLGVLSSCRLIGAQNTSNYGIKCPIRPNLWSMGTTVPATPGIREGTALGTCIVRRLINPPAGSFRIGRSRIKTGRAVRNRQEEAAIRCVEAAPVQSLAIHDSSNRRLT